MQIDLALAVMHR